MSLKDTRFLSELSKETGITVKQLSRRVNKLIEEGALKKDRDYKKAEGKTQPIILSKEGIKKVIERSWKSIGKQYNSSRNSCFPK